MIKKLKTIAAPKKFQLIKITFPDGKEYVPKKLMIVTENTKIPIMDIIYNKKLFKVVRKNNTSK